MKATIFEKWVWLKFGFWNSVLTG